MFEKFLNQRIECETTKIAARPQVFDYPEANTIKEMLTKPWATWELRDNQAQALYTIRRMNGAVVPLDVGEGKTLVATLAGKVLDANKVAILLPKPLEREFWNEYERYKEHFWVHENITLVPYSTLSSRKQADILDTLQPDLIIADEAQALFNTESARTRRFLHYMGEHPETKFVPMTGTFFRDSIKNAAHLVFLALRHNSPIPLTAGHLEAWSNCLDVGKEPTVQESNLFYKLHDAFTVPRRPDLHRRAFHLRFSSSEGVVATDSPVELPPIHIDYLTSPSIPREIREALISIRDTNETPDGEQVIIDEEQMHTIEKRLSAGFFYKWDWEAIGGYDEEWVMRRKTWGKALRQELAYNARPGYDTPLFIANKLDRDLAARPALANSSQLHWSRAYWNEVSDRPAPPNKTVWISNFFVDYVREVLRAESRPWIAWYSSTALYEVFTRWPWKVFGAGSSFPKEGRGSYNAFASINVHRAGVNLQDWSRMFVIEPPSDGIIMQQMLGRLHRTGQKETVYCSMWAHSPHYNRAIEKAREKALYRQEMESIPQKLLLGEKR